MLDNGPCMPRREAPTVTVTVPGCTAPSEQDSALVPSTAQVPAVVLALAPDRAVFSWSATVTAAAVDGPALVTVSVKVTAWPGTGLAGVIVLVMATSAEGAPSPVTVEVLLAGPGRAWVRIPWRCCSGCP